MAQKTGSRRHTHKYFKRNEVWACGLPDCSHFLPLNVGTPLGKKSICWNCGSEIILDEDNMIEDRPQCLKCKGVDVESLGSFLNQKGI